MYYQWQILKQLFKCDSMSHDFDMHMNGEVLKTPGVSDGGSAMQRLP
jgi:hypothetical protein